MISVNFQQPQVQEIMLYTLKQWLVNPEILITFWKSDRWFYKLYKRLYNKSTDMWMYLSTGYISKLFF